MRAQPKPFKPEHHKVISQEHKNKRSNTGTAFKLQWNRKLAEQGICRGIDTEIFFPDKEIFRPEEEQVFARMCVECPVMLTCLEWGLAHERYGIWGGTTPYRRQVERKRRGWAITEPLNMV